MCDGVGECYTCIDRGSMARKFGGMKLEMRNWHRFRLARKSTTAGDEFDESITVSLTASAQELDRYGQNVYSCTVF